MCLFSVKQVADDEAGQCCRGLKPTNLYGSVQARVVHYGQVSVSISP